MRTPEQRLATKLRKEGEREARRYRVLKQHPLSVRYAKAKFKKGKKHAPKHRAQIKLGVQ